MKRIALLMSILLVLSAGGTYLYLNGSHFLDPLRPVVTSLSRLAKDKLAAVGAAKRKPAPASKSGADGAKTAGTPGTPGAGGDATTTVVWTEIQKKSDELAAKEKALNDRETQLILAEQRLVQEQQAFSKVKADVGKLAEMYEAMRPSEAAAVLGRLPERQAANLLAQMDGSKAGKIMAYFQAELAARLSMMLAGN